MEPEFNFIKKISQFGLLFVNATPIATPSPHTCNPISIYSPSQIRMVPGPRIKLELVNSVCGVDIIHQDATIVKSNGTERAFCLCWKTWKANQIVRAATLANIAASSNVIHLSSTLSATEGRVSSRL